MNASRLEKGKQGKMVGITYTAVEAQYTTCPENVHECAQHALWAIWCASLKADLLGVSSSFGMSKVGPLPLLLNSISLESFCLLSI